MPVNYDPHDVYQGRAVASPDNSRRHSPPQQSSGLAYDDAQDYPPPHGTHQQYPSQQNDPYGVYYNQRGHYGEDTRGGGAGYAV